ncbi:MAG: hypothetical protein K2K23_00150, partial [Muribaculaceae bacterium]|nr:hypothetical protein [Muribaculaceae bacterium]
FAYPRGLLQHQQSPSSNFEISSSNFIAFHSLVRNKSEFRFILIESLNMLNKSKNMLREFLSKFKSFLKKFERLGTHFRLDLSAKTLISRLILSLSRCHISVGEYFPRIVSVSDLIVISLCGTVMDGNIPIQSDQEK